MKTLNLKLRFAVVMSVGALALVFGMGAISMHYAQRDLLETLSNQQLGIVSRAAADVDEKLKFAVDSLTAAATAIPREAIDTDQKFEAFFLQQPGLLQIFDDVLVAENGIIKADYPNVNNRLGVDISDRRYFQQVLATGKPVISEPILGKVVGLPVVSVAAPIVDSDGRIVAVMVGLLQLAKSDILVALSAARFGRTGYFTVLTTGSRPIYLAHPDPTKRMGELPQKRSPAMEHVLGATGQGVVVSTLADGAEALVSYRPLKQAGWIVTAILPGAEAFAAIDHARARTIGIAVIAAVLALPLVWLFAWRMLQPLTALRAQVEQIAADPSGTALATEGSDEVGEVAAAFNAMLQGQRSAEARRIASERDRRRLIAILENSKDFVAITDPDGRLTYLNASGRLVCGLGANDDIGDTTLHDYLSPWAADRLAAVGVPAALADGIWLGETAVMDGNAREIPTDHTFVAHRDADGRVDYFSSLLHDTSAAKALAAAMRESEARMLLIADALPVLVAFINCDYRYSFVNSRYEDHFGIERSKLIGRSIAELVGPADYEKYLPYLKRAALGETQFEIETLAGRQPVHFVVKLIPQFDDRGELAGYHFVHQDITDHKAEHRRLAELANADALTGLLNRAGFEGAIHAAMQRSRVHLSAMALFYLDIDRFKSINDRNGHLVGDALLRSFAERLVHAVRGTDIVARLGGDEFVVIAEGLRSVDDVGSIAQNILTAMRPDFEFGGVTSSITTSIGVAVYIGSDRTTEELVARADAALYRAKNAGRDRYDLDDPSQALGLASVGSGADGSSGIV